MYVCMTVCCLTPLAIGSTCQLSEIRIDNSTQVSDVNSDVIHNL